MKEKILQHIENELVFEKIEEGLDASDDLLGGGIVDSMGMVKLIAFIEDQFEIKVKPEEMLIENFMTVGHIVDFIKTK